MSQSFLAPCSTVELGDNDPAIPTVGQVTWSPLYFPVTPLPFVALLLGGQLDRPIDVPDAAVSRPGARTASSMILSRWATAPASRITASHTRSSWRSSPWQATVTRRNAGTEAVQILWLTTQSAHGPGRQERCRSSRSARLRW